MNNETKSEMISLRLTPFERHIAEAVVARREQELEEPYFLSDLVREALLSHVRADLKKLIDE